MHNSPGFCSKKQKPVILKNCRNINYTKCLFILLFFPGDLWFSRDLSEDCKQSWFFWSLNQPCYSLFITLVISCSLQQKHISVMKETPWVTLRKAAVRWIPRAVGWRTGDLIACMKFTAAVSNAKYRLQISAVLFPSLLTQNKMEVKLNFQHTVFHTVSSPGMFPHTQPAPKGEQ